MLSKILDIVVHASFKHPSLYLLFGLSKSIVFFPILIHKWGGEKNNGRENFFNQITEGICMRKRREENDWRAMCRKEKRKYNDQVESWEVSVFGRNCTTRGDNHPKKLILGASIIFGGLKQKWFIWAKEINFVLRVRMIETAYLLVDWGKRLWRPKKTHHVNSSELYSKSNFIAHSFCLSTPIINHIRPFRILYHSYGFIWLVWSML